MKRREKAQIVDPENEVYVSAVSTWEVAIKVAIGKLRLPDGQDPGVYLPVSIRRANFSSLSITTEHTYGVSSLARHHADPFDRLLISQARIDGLTVATSDRIFSKYDVATIFV